MRIKFWSPEFCCKVYTVGIPLITFTGNLPDRAFPGNARRTRESRSVVDRAFDFVPGCKLSLLPRYPNTCSSIAYRLFISRIEHSSFHLLGKAAHVDKNVVQSWCISFPPPVWSSKQEYSLWKASLNVCASWDSLMSKEKPILCVSLTHGVRSCFDTCKFCPSTSWGAAIKINALLDWLDRALKIYCWAACVDHWFGLWPSDILGLDYGHQRFRWRQPKPHPAPALYRQQCFRDDVFWQQHLVQNLTLEMPFCPGQCNVSNGWHEDGTHAFVHAGFWVLIDPREGSADKREVLVHGPSCVSKTWAEGSDRCRLNKTEAFCLGGGWGRGGSRNTLLKWARS